MNGNTAAENSPVPLPLNAFVRYYLVGEILSLAMRPALKALEHNLLIYIFELVSCFNVV